MTKPYHICSDCEGHKCAYCKESFEIHAELKEHVKTHFYKKNAD